jgi:hypothetical protein
MAASVVGRGLSYSRQYFGDSDCNTCERVVPLTSSKPFFHGSPLRLLHNIRNQRLRIATNYRPWHGSSHRCHTLGSYNGLASLRPLAPKEPIEIRELDGHT